MADIKTRAGEGRPLTNDEVDANFTNLNTDKAENGANSDITSLAGITGGVSTADYVDFDTLATGVARATGRLTWNSNDGCLEVGLIGSDVTQQIGQEMVTRVYNADSTTIANGEVVYFWSTAGEVIAGKKYIANATIDPHLIVGLATEDIAAGAYGYVTEFGFVRGLDTAAFNPGDILFASPTTAGAIQSNEPSTPNDVVRVGICLESDSTNGIVLVNPHDVPRSDEIRYDNSDSGLSATNVKSAIDELELVKADIALLTSNVTFYLTSANDAVLSGYKQLVTSTLDTNYDEIAFDYLTGTISNTATMLQAWASDVNVLVGDIAGIVVPIVGNIRKDTGSGDARFYFEVYIRESDGTETLVTTSNVSDYVTSTIYGQISLSATVSLQTFTDTDRVVIKLYGQTDSSTAQYELQLGGTSPFRSLFPVPVSVVPSVANAYAIVADTTNFDGKLSSTDNNVQAALETLDDHVHQASEITGLTASNTTTTTTQFNGHLSGTDTDIQKALNTLDDVGLQGITDVGATTTTAVTINASLDVDDLKLDGDTISNDGAAVDGNIVLSPKGAGEVDISKVDIDGGAIDGTTIGGTTPGAGTFTDLTVNTTATFAGATIADLGTVTTANIDGGTIDGVTLDATIADIDNIRIDGNSIISTNGNGNIDLTPNGTGEVNISKVDIAGGEIDGTTIGANAAAAGNFTALDVSTSASFAGATIDNLGTVTTADINGGTIDGADITVGAGKTLSVINGTLTLADNQISGDKVDGGIISNFQSQGIDDNATSTQLTISNTSASFAGDLAVDTDTLYVDSTANKVGIGVSGTLTNTLNFPNAASIGFKDTGGNFRNALQFNASNELQIGAAGAGISAITLGPNGSEWVTVNSAGNVSISGDLTVDTNTLYVDSTNNRVGVGTSTPWANLSILSAAGGTAKVTFGGETNASREQRFHAYYEDVNQTFNIASFSSPSTVSPIMTMNTSGNVGIGQDPTYKLDVLSTTGDAARIQSTSTRSDLWLQASGTSAGFVRMRASGNDLQLISGNGVTATLDDNGNFGIGTGSTVSAPLHVGRAASGTYSIFDDGANGRFTFAAVTGGTNENRIFSTTTGFGAYEDLNIIGDNLLFSTGGPTGVKMKIDSSGNVKINRTGNISGNPEKLGVQASNTTVLALYKPGTGSQNIAEYYSDTGGYGLKSIIKADGGAFFNGNVGIKNNSPNRTLNLGDGSGGANAEINSTSSPNFLFSRGGTEVGYIGTTLWNTGSGSDFEFSLRGLTAIGFCIGSSQKARLESSGLFRTYYGITSTGAGTNFAANIEIGTTNSYGTSSNAQLKIGMFDSSAAAVNGSQTYGYTLNVGGGASGQDLDFVQRRRSAASRTAMRLDRQGNLLVGTTSSTSPLSSDGHALLATGVLHTRIGASGTGVKFQVGGSLAGGITVINGGTPAFFSSSDIDLKKNVIDHESELANVMSIQTRRWDWKDEEKGSGEGVVAQELEQTAWADLVSEGEDGYKQVAGLGTVETRLIKAIQEQQAMIEELKAEVAALKGAN